MYRTLATAMIALVMAGCTTAAPAATAPSDPVGARDPAGSGRVAEPAGLPSVAIPPSAETLAAFCGYATEFLAIGEAAALDALVAARDGNPEAWVRSAGPEAVADAGRLADLLEVVGTWPEAGDAANKASASLDAWTAALEATLAEPSARSRYAEVFAAWDRFIAEHNRLLASAGSLKGHC